MTQLLFGDREVLIGVIGGARVLVASEEGLDVRKFELAWRRKLLKPEPIAVLNPPKDVPKGLLPRPGYFILFDRAHLKFYKGKLPVEWERWARTHGVPISEKSLPDAKVLEKQLVSGGLYGITFTPEAAAWYTRVVGTSMVRLGTELQKVLNAGLVRIDLETAVALIGGSEELKAERILKTLGTHEACRLGLSVPEKRAIPLMAYLSKVLENRRSTLGLALDMVWRGADAKRFDYWTGVQIFLHHCQQMQQTTDPREQADLTLELLALCGTNNWFLDRLEVV